MLYIFDLICII